MVSKCLTSGQELPGQAGPSGFPFSSAFATSLCASRIFFCSSHVKAVLRRAEPCCTA